MDKVIKEAVENYQCPGCVCGMDTQCYEKSDSEECGKHVVGTTLIPVGKIFLGLSTGFCRLGVVPEMKLSIFKSFEEGWGYNKLNVPVWKYLDEYGNTVVRGISPRINSPFLHIFIGNQLSKINCLEIMDSDLEEMD